MGGRYFISWKIIDIKISRLTPALAAVLEIKASDNKV